jgi:hypothetical protein
MIQATSARVRNSGRVALVVLPLALVTWAQTARSAGVEPERRFEAPAALAQPSSPLAKAPEGPCRKSVGATCSEGPTDRATTLILMRRAEGQVLTTAGASSRLSSGEFEPVLRTASSGWEWGAGSAALAAWLIGLRRRFQRPKAETTL